jgi:hypothetical protein
MRKAKIVVSAGCTIAEIMEKVLTSATKSKLVKLHFMRQASVSLSFYRR